MISIMQPKGSWVARCTNKTGCVPGIYAMTVEIADYNPEEDDTYERRHNDDYEDDENDNFLEQRKK